MTGQNFLARLKRLPFLIVMLAVIFCVAPFYYHSNIGGTALNLPANIIVWFCVCLFLWLTSTQVLKHKQLVKPDGLLIVMAFPLLATTSGFITGVEQPMEWLFRLIFIWGGVLFLLALFQYKELEQKTNTILFIIVLSALLHALVAAIQILQPEGMSLILPRTPEGNRPTGMFLQVNNQASYQATSLLIIFFLATTRYLNNRRLLLITMLAVTLGTFIIAASGSRVGALGLIIGLPLLLLLRLNALKQHMAKVVILTIMLILGFGLGTLTSGFGHLVSKSADNTEYSSGERVVIYSTAAELVKQKPIFGHGIGSFAGKWQYQKAEYLKQHPQTEFQAEYVTHPHNELLFWQVEGGLLASIGILITTFAFAYRLWRCQAIYFLAILFPLALHLQVELPFYLSAAHWFVFLLIMALGLRQGEVKQVLINVSEYMHLMLKSSNHVLFIIAVAFLIHSFYANKQLAAVRDGGELEIAKVNPYFNVMAEELYMQQVYFASMDARSKEGLRYFLQWAESAVTSRPVATTFLFMVSSYQTLGLAREACDTAGIGSSIYPNDIQLSNFYEACSSDN